MLDHYSNSRPSAISEEGNGLICTCYAKVLKSLAAGVDFKMNAELLVREDIVGEERPVCNPRVA